ncbi:ATP-binding protein [Salegentibacter tibetensis]|uniref:ATP-binding protein n=1 Tax=Salegentibacter tibetensis TaxID=2873600 RepID=UPI0037449268
MNIVSPGSLPNNITMEDIFNGRSESRNRVLANIFKELGLIEQWGSGINRIINSCKEYGLPTPKIEEQNDFMDIEIIRSQDDLQTIKPEVQPIEADYDRLSEEEKQLLLYLLDHNQIVRKEAVQLLKIGETKTEEVFNELMHKKLIERKGKGRATFYKLNHN